MRKPRQIHDAPSMNPCELVRQILLCVPTKGRLHTSQLRALLPEMRAVVAETERAHLRRLPVLPKSVWEAAA